MGKKGRSSGEGHVRYRPSDNIWEARLYVPVKMRPAYGGQRTLSFYGRTESEALQKRGAAKEDMREGAGSKDLTFGRYLARWLSHLDAMGTVAESTASDYCYYAERILIPRLGHMPLVDLSPEDLDLLYARLVKEGVGARTINHAHATARVALQRAAKKRLIRTNPARDADPPRYSTDEREYDILSREEVGRFFEAAASLGDRFEAFFVVAVLSGARPAELRALAWQDTGLDSLTIRRTASQTRTGAPEIRNTTKTRKARVVPLMPEAANALKAHRARQNAERLALGDLWEDRGLVFPDSQGNVMRRENLSRRHMKPVLQKAGLSSSTRIYDLRHTFATLWMESGEDATTLQGILGHARITTTMDKYVHPTDKARRDAMGRFGAGFGGS